MGIVTLIALRFLYGGMHDRPVFLLLMTRYADSSFLDNSNQAWMKGAVRVVALITLYSKDHFVVTATFQFRVAFQAQVRDVGKKKIFKVRAVGIVAVITTLYGWRMIIPGVQFARMAVHANERITRSG